MQLDYKFLALEKEKLLENAQSVVLATSADNKVTARTMSYVNDGLLIMFQTGEYSEKATQMKQNSRVALATGNMQIEAEATFNEHPNKNRVFLEKYKTKFPKYYAMYTNLHDEILVIARPTKISLYKYVDGNPCIDVLDLENKNAYRKV